MNLEYLEDLLGRAKDLSAKNHEADDIKIKTSEAIKVLFPDESVLAGEINRLDFSPIVMMSGIYNYKRFWESKTRLVSTIEAKIEVLKNRNIALSEQGSLNTAEMEICKKALIDLQSENNKLRRINKEQGKTHEKNRLMLLEQAQVYKSKSETDLKETKRLRIFKDWSLGVAILTAVLGLGVFLGNYKYDSDKINMADKIREQKNTIDSLKKDRADSLKQKIKIIKELKNT